MLSAVALVPVVLIPLVSLFIEQNFGRGDDADKLLEDLLKQHGEVVYSSGASPAAEADDDAECLSCTCLAAPPFSSPDAYLRYRQTVCCVPISFELADRRRRRIVG